MQPGRTMTFEASEISRAEAFRTNARILLDAGFSANQILQSARELGFGVRRSEGLAIIRDFRELQAAATAAGAAITEITAMEPPREYKWGTLTQETGEYLRFDGPHALLFQVGGDAGPGWQDYIILPEDQDVTGFRIVTEEDEPSDPNDTRNGPYYRTSGSFPAGASVSSAIRRLGADSSRVVRVIFDLP